MSCAVGWSGCVRKKRNGNHFFGVENSKKKSEERGQKLGRNSDPFLVPLSIGTFPEGSENGRIFGPAFWCRRATFELVLGSVQSGRGATISSARCIRITPKCSQLLLVLNTYSFQTIKLKLAAFLPSAASTVAGVSFSTFVRFHSLIHRILLLSLSMNLQQLNELCCWMEWLRKKKEKR